MRLKDKVILVTASTRGIGLAIVKACAQEGGTVYMAARDLVRAQKEADKLNACGCQAYCVYNDATKPESLVSMVDETGIFVQLDVGAECRCPYPYRSRPPRDARVIVKISGIDMEKQVTWGSINYVTLPK